MIIAVGEGELGQVCGKDTHILTSLLRGMCPVRLNQIRNTYAVLMALPWA